MRIERARPLTDTTSVVSVVVPCYNYGHYLPDAVGSVLSQGVPVEVIIVDDCSTDDSTKVADRLAEQHPEVRLVRNEHNLGHIATYNKGLGMVSGEYVVLLSADDMLAPGSLRRAVSLFERHPSVGLVYGYAEPFTDVPPPVWSTGTWTVWPGSTWVDLVCHRGDNAIFNPEAIMRTSLLRALGGGYDPSSPHAADMLLWLGAAGMADVGRVNRVQGYYRTHSAQMHLTTYAGKIRDMRARAEVYDALFGPGAAAPHAGRRRWGLRSIEREAAWSATLARCAGNEDERAEYVRVAQDIADGHLSSFVWRLDPGPTGSLVGRLVQAAYALKWNLKSRRWRWLGI
jgi:glycosyltransferase involved in cell wall biosynthesis